MPRFFDPPGLINDLLGYGRLCARACEANAKRLYIKEGRMCEGFAIIAEGAIFAEIRRTLKSCPFLVSVPPRKLVIVDENGREAMSRIGPYSEGSRVRVNCEVTGGERETCGRDKTVSPGEEEGYGYGTAGGPQKSVCGR